MTSKENPIQLQELEAHGITVSETTSLGMMVRRRRWRKTDSFRNDLSPKGRELASLVHAMVTYGFRATSTRDMYYRIAYAIKWWDDETIDLWQKELSKEFKAQKNFEKPDRHFINHFSREYRIETAVSDLSYLSGESRRDYMYNVIRLAKPRDKHNRQRPLVLKSSYQKMLDPHYSLWERKMTERELLEAEGILRLHNAWRSTMDVEEAKKVQRFMAIHADNITTAERFIEERYVKDLDELNDLLNQASGNAAVSGGAL